MKSWTELNTLSNFRSTALLGCKATKTAFEHSHLNKQKTIHLSVHAVANPQHPDRAALICPVMPPQEMMAFSKRMKSSS